MNTEQQIVAYLQDHGQTMYAYEWRYYRAQDYYYVAVSDIREALKDRPVDEALWTLIDNKIVHCTWRFGRQIVFVETDRPYGNAGVGKSVDDEDD